MRRTDTLAFLNSSSFLLGLVPAQKTITRVYDDLVNMVRANLSVTRTY
jgi:hypothetical protein